MQKNNNYHDVYLPDEITSKIIFDSIILLKNENWRDMITLFDKAMEINPEKVVEIRGAFISVKEAVSNYVDFYWAKEFNAGVAQFKKMQDEPDKKQEYLGLAIDHFSNAVLINPSDANSHATLA